MSGGSAKREMEAATSHGKAPSRESSAKGREESPPRVKLHRSGDKKKKMKKVVYYETDSSSPSTFSSDAPSVTSKRHERKKFSKIPLRYPRISKRTPLLSVPLGKPPVCDGEDYSMWSVKMKDHLNSLHKSIWDVVEYGAQVPQVRDKDYDSDEADQIRHFNSQATTILLASLSQEEYNKVHGLETAKDIWDVLKTTHEGDEVTKITKRETIEGELGRFVLNHGEEPQAMYNRLKTMANQVHNLESTKWDDHEMVNVILRSLVFRNPMQVQLIRGDPRYKLMSPEEVIGSTAPNKSSTWRKAAPPHPRCNPSHSKRRRRRKMSLHQVGSPSMAPSSTTRRWRSSSRASVKSSSKGGGRTTNPAPRGCATNVVSPVILSLSALCLVIVIGTMT
jgi:hypothetical protein